MRLTKKQSRIQSAIRLLDYLGLPKAQQNERSALTLLALLDITPNKKWALADNPILGITPIMDWIKEKYEISYAPNTREAVRRQTIHQFIQAGIVLINPDDVKRPTNSPKTVYQINPKTLALIRHYGSPEWHTFLEKYLLEHKPLSEQYAQEREQIKIPLTIKQGEVVQLSPGKHSELIKNIIEDFAQRFVPGGRVVYIGDTGEKFGYIDNNLLKSLNINIDIYGNMPDVILYYEEKKWLLLIEAVTSHGPVDAKRHKELSDLFQTSKAGLVFVTAFPTISIMSKYLNEIAWETEVWVAEAPSHLIHFDGERFLGPY